MPFADHIAWIERCAPALERYGQASTDRDMDTMASSLVELLKLPGEYLYKQRISTHARRMLNRQQQRGNEWQLQRLRSRLLGDRAMAVPAPARDPAAPAAAASAVVAPHDNAVPDDEDDDSKYYDSSDDMDALAVDNGCTQDDLRAIKQARRLIASGYMHRASRAAATTLRTLDCNDSAVLQQLRQLHPAASPTPMPALPHDADEPIVLNDSALKRLVRRCNNGKAGGPSGGNGAMFAVLADNQTCC